MLDLVFQMCGCQGHRPTASLALDGNRTAYVEKTGSTFALMLLRDKQYESGPYLNLSETELEEKITERPS